MSDKLLRYYQREAFDACVWGFEEFNSQVLHLGTGAGKTFVAAKIIESFLPRRTLFVADQKELVSQSARVAVRDISVIPGIDAAKLYAPLDAALVVASSQTLEKRERIERFPHDHFDLVIHDECHRRPDIAQRISDHFVTAKKLGLTGTPFRSTIADLSPWYQTVAYSKPVIDLITEGFAPLIRIANLEVTFDLENAKVKRGIDGKDYDLDSIDSIIAPHYAEIAEQLAQKSKGYHGVAFLPLIRSSEAFAVALRQAGLRAQHVDGDSRDRRAILEAFEAGELDWITNSNLISTGVDIPIASAFLNLRLTSSRVFYQQARGRTLRCLPGVIDHLPERHQAEERRMLIAASAKPHTLIFDVLLQNDRLGAVHAIDDLCDSTEDAEQAEAAIRQQRDEVDAEALAREIQRQRELKLREALERAAIRTSMKTPMRTAEIGAILNEPRLFDYKPVARWEQDAPTPAQLSALEDKLVDTRTIKSKGEANMILTIMSERYRAGFATIKQVKLLRQYSDMNPNKAISSPELLSKDSASILIDDCFSGRR